MEPTDLARVYDRSQPTAAPAYERVKQMIVSEIAAGRWRAGDRLPSEYELVDALNLSRMTVNRALRELSSAGVVDRLMGVGTFVATPTTTTPLMQVRNIAEEVQSQGHRHRSEVVFVREEPGATANALFDAEFGVAVYHSLIVHFADGTPIQLEDRFVDPQQAPGYLEQDFTAGTPHSYLMAVAPMVRGRHVVEAITATADECGLLRVERTEPILLIRRRTWSRSGLVSAVRLLHPGSRNRLEGDFTREHA